VQDGRVGFLQRVLRDEGVRLCFGRRGVGRVRAVTVGAADVVAPVLAAPVVVVLLTPRVACETGFGDLLGRLMLENANLEVLFFDLGRVLPGVNRCVDRINVRLACAVAGLAADYLALPTRFVGELGVGRVREVVELIFVAVATAFRPDVIGRVGGWLCGCRRWWCVLFIASGVRTEQRAGAEE